MTTFIAIYSGETVAGAEIVAITADPDVVRHVVETLDIEQQRRMRALQREVNGRLDEVLDEIDEASREEQ